MGELHKDNRENFFGLGSWKDVVWVSLIIIFFFLGYWLITDTLHSSICRFLWVKGIVRT